MLHRFTEPRTHTFETYITRGRTEREYLTEVEYRIHAGRKQAHTQPGEDDSVEIVRTTVIGGDFDLTDYEMDAIQAEAETDAVETLAEMRAEYAEYRYEAAQEPRWVA